MAKTNLTGTVLTYWEDLQDNDRAYNMGTRFLMQKPAMK